MPPRGRYAPLVVRAFGDRIGGHSVQDVHVFLLDVHMGEKIVPHEAVVALGMVRRKAHVLVHIEGDHVGEGNLFLPMQGDELLIDAQGAGPGGQPQDEGLLRRGGKGPNPAGDVLGGPAADGVVARLNDQSHVVS